MHGDTVQDVTKTRDGAPATNVFKSMQRDMPISYDHQMENLCDPVGAPLTRWTVVWDSAVCRRGAVGMCMVMLG